jgi:integrase
LSSIQHDVDRFITRCRTLGRADNTLRHYRSRLDHFARCCRQDDVARVTDDDLEEYLGVDCAHLSPSSRKDALLVLSSFFSWLHDRGRIERHPARSLSLSKPMRPRPTFYRPEQAAAVIQATQRPLDRLLIALLLRHGQRISSVIALRWQDVSFEDAVIHYPAVKRGEPMSLPFDYDTGRLLKAARALAGDDAEHIFPAQRRRRGPTISQSYARAILADACRRAGVPYRGLHELRRTCVTTLLRGGVPLHVVSKQVAGHASVATTVRNYAGIDDDDVGQALRRLPF